MRYEYFDSKYKGLDNQNANAALENVLRSISIQAFNVIIACGIRDLDGMLSISEDELHMIKGVKPETIQEILKARNELSKIQQACIPYFPKHDRPDKLPQISEAKNANNGDSSNQKQENKTQDSYQPINLEELPEGSILRKALRSLYTGANVDEAKFYECAERILLSELGLPPKDILRLLNVALLSDDSLADICSLTIGYLFETGISDQAFSTLLTGLNNAFGHSQGFCFDVGQLEDSSIICDSDVKGISNLRLDVFNVPKQISLSMQGMGIMTWHDAVGHSERNVINMYGISSGSLRCVYYLWFLKKYADIRLIMPEEAYSSFEGLVDYYIGLGALTPREKTIIKGRLGLLNGRQQCTLEELGKIEGITRERVRQIEKKCINKLQHFRNKKKLQPLQEAVSHILAGSGGICLADELAESLGSLWSWPSVPAGENMAALIAAIGNFQVVRELRASVMTESCPCLKCTRAEQILTREVDESPGFLAIRDVARILSDSCKHECRFATLENVNFACGYVLHIAERCTEIKTDGDYLYNQMAWMHRYGKLSEIIEAVMQKYNRAMHFTEVYQKLCELRHPDETLSEHNVYACMERSSSLLLWDKGTYIHHSHIVIPHDLIHEIENFILKRMRIVPFVSVSGVFMIFKERLVQLGVPTESALYSCLRETNKERLAYPRYPYVVHRKDELQRLPLPLVLEQFVSDQEGVVSLDKIRDYLIGQLYVSEQMLYIHIYNIPNVINIGEAQFIHIDKLNIDHGRLRPILDYIDLLLESTNHIAVTKIFNEKKVTCKLLEIMNPFMLYAVLQLYCSEQYDLSKYPRIRMLGVDKQGKRSVGVSLEISEYIRKKNTPCSYDELLHHFVDELGYKQNTVYNVRLVRDDVKSYSQGAVVHLATLDWTAEKQQLLEQVAAEHCSEREQAGKFYGLITHLYEFAKLPDLPVCAPWTTTLIGELLCRNGSFLIIGTQRNAFVPASNAAGIKNLADLIYEILKIQYGGAANLTTFEKDMRDAGVLQKSLTPMMLGDESRVTIKGNTVVLMELC